MSLRGGNTPHDYYDVDWQFIDMTVPEKRYSDPILAAYQRLATEVILHAFREVIGDTEDAAKAEAFLLTNSRWHELAEISQEFVRRTLRKIHENPEKIKTRYNIKIGGKTEDAEEDKENVGALGFDGADQDLFDGFARN